MIENSLFDRPFAEPSIDSKPTTTSKPIMTVTELNRLAREVLTQHFPLFWVSGELSNLTRAASGHWYFSLKDTSAQVRCVMFKGRNSDVDWRPSEGDKVEARAQVTLYEARGEFQLTIESLQRAGLGALFEAYEALKRKLQLEGLFDIRHKKPLPTLAQAIGIVTSPDAAALRDVLTTLKRRMPSIPIVIYPCPVQGKDAAGKIAQAITIANKRRECDVLIICRGGGSIEDLWQFNEEIVARAIADCDIPTISAVGHETDFTISDFVADVRAATPTAAAEIASPDRAQLINKSQQLSQQLARAMQQHLRARNQAVDYLARNLISPLQKITQQRNQIMDMHGQLVRAMQQQLHRHQLRLSHATQSLQHLNPNAVLQRGYAYVQTSNGALVTDSQQLKLDEMVRLTFAHGNADAIIQHTQSD